MHRRGHVRGAPPVALPRPEPSEFLAHRCGVAQAEVDADLVGQRGEHPRMSAVALGGSAGSNGRRRPSQLTNVPAFSVTGATGNTTSARSVTALWRNSRLTTNGAASTAASAAAGSGRSSSSTPPIEQRAAANRRSPHARMPDGVAARRVRQVVDVPGGGHLAARGGVGRPACRRAEGWAPHRLPARRGRRRVAAPSPAVRRSPRPVGAPPSRRRASSASRSPTRITVPGGSSSCSASSAAASPPGAVAMSVPPIFVQPAGGERCDRRSPSGRACGRPCAAAGRRSATPLPARSPRAAPRARISRSA